MLQHGYIKKDNYNLIFNEKKQSNAFHQNESIPVDNWTESDFTIY